MRISLLNFLSIFVVFGITLIGYFLASAFGKPFKETKRFKLISLALFATYVIGDIWFIYKYESSAAVLAISNIRDAMEARKVSQPQQITNAEPTHLEVPIPELILVASRPISLTTREYVPNKNGSGRLGWVKSTKIIETPTFKIGKYEVTFEEYDAFASETGQILPDDRGWGRGNMPVMNISRESAEKYIDWLSTKTGRKFALPTNEQWMSAFLAHTDQFDATDHTKKVQYHCEFELNANCRGCQGSRSLGIEEGQEQPLAVGSLPGNALGLHDMSGNLWEYLSPTGIRGAGFASSTWDVCYLDYIHSKSGNPSPDVGFRIVEIIP